jgi:glucose-1-phosphate adenylyltransferase
VVGQGAIVGSGPYDDRPNKQEPSRLNTGITVVGKRAVIPRGARLGRNVKVAAKARTTDFVTKVIRSGESVEMRPGGRRVHDHGRGLHVQEAAAGAGVGRR